MTVSPLSAVTTELEIALPPPTQTLSQDKEWCVVHWDGEWHKVLVHDYEKIFEIPGLYEQLIYEVLDCRSPATVRRLLQQELAKAGVSTADLHVLDLGAGNGMVAEELAEVGVGSVTGIDIIAAAAQAAERDRPGVYADYHVLDMTSLSEEEEGLFPRNRLNCLVCVAALGFGDIPSDAFTNAFNLVNPGAWVAFNIKEEFLRESDRTGFSRLIERLESTGALKIQTKHRYQHRLGTNHEPIYYVAVVGRKTVDAPPFPASPVADNGVPKLEANGRGKPGTKGRGNPGSNGREKSP